MLYLFEVIVQMYFVSIKIDVIDLPSKRGIRSIIALKMFLHPNINLNNAAFVTTYSGREYTINVLNNRKQRASRKGHEDRLGLFR